MDFQFDLISVVIGAIVAFVVLSGTLLRAKQASLQKALENLQEALRDKAIAETKAERIQELNQENEELQRLISMEREKVASLSTAIEAEKRMMAEKVEAFEKAELRLVDTFKALSADALNRNNQSFLNLAHEALSKHQDKAKEDLHLRQKEVEKIIQPISETLSKMDAKVLDLEKQRVGAYASLTQQVQNLMETQKELRNETSSLSKALRAPQVRGQWGEMQLKRVVEMAGMLHHCDFVEQPSTTTADGRLRPDMIVKLPGGRKIIVDAKAPLNSYLEALNTEDEHEKLRHLQAHAKHVRTHINSLSSRSYWDQPEFNPSPEFVVLFLPGETFFSAALEQDPTLIETGAKEKVILATPTTLIALLRAVSYGWRQERLAENAKIISDLGKEMYERLQTMGKHMARLGKNLNTAVESYNSTLSTLEKRVLVSARKFQSLGVAPDGASLDDAQQLDHLARLPQAEELSTQEDAKKIG